MSVHKLCDLIDGLHFVANILEDKDRKSVHIDHEDFISHTIFFPYDLGFTLCMQLGDKIKLSMMLYSNSYTYWEYTQTYYRAYDSYYCDSEDEAYYVRNKRYADVLGVDPNKDAIQQLADMLGNHITQCFARGEI